MIAPSAVLEEGTSRQRPANTFLIWKAPVLASAVMAQSWAVLLASQSWISMRVPFAVPLEVVPTHLFVFAFMAIFQAVPFGWIANFSDSSLELAANCVTAVPAFVEPFATSSALPVVCIGVRL